jgi:hypothetical protein
MARLTRRYGSRETPVTGELYLRLVRMFPLRPLRSDADLDRAVAMSTP